MKKKTKRNLKFKLRNGSVIMLPAPEFIRDATNQASTRTKDLVVDVALGRKIP
jgi:hypothetical protein